MDKRIYINDFCEDLNYRSVILYIGEVDSEALLKALERDNVNNVPLIIPDFLLTQVRGESRFFQFLSLKAF